MIAIEIISVAISSGSNPRFTRLLVKDKFTAVCSDNSIALSTSRSSSAKDLSQSSSFFEN